MEVICNAAAILEAVSRRNPWRHCHFISWAVCPPSGYYAAAVFGYDLRGHSCKGGRAAGQRPGGGHVRRLRPGTDRAALLSAGGRADRGMDPLRYHSHAAVSRAEYPEPQVLPDLLFSDVQPGGADYWDLLGDGGHHRYCDYGGSQGGTGLETKCPPSPTPRC